MFYITFKMDRDEEDNFLRLLENVEKEEVREKDRRINPQAIQRQLFINESAVQPINKLMIT